MSAVDPFRFAMNLKAVWKITARRRWPQMLATSKKKPREENSRGFLGSLESKKTPIDHIRWDPDGENAQTTSWLRFKSSCLCTRRHSMYLLMWNPRFYRASSFVLPGELIAHRDCLKTPSIGAFQDGSLIYPSWNLTNPAEYKTSTVGDWRLRFSGTDTRRDFEQKKEEKEKFSLSLIDWQYILIWIAFAS